jgi:uncharacterized coiled-coil protein SlyX
MLRSAFGTICAFALCADFGENCMDGMAAPRQLAQGDRICNLIVRYDEQARVIERRDHSLVEQSLQAKESMLIELHTELDKLRSQLRKQERLSDDASKVRASPPPSLSPPMPR